jgi:hypothetical protein
LTDLKSAVGWSNLNTFTETLRARLNTSIIKGRRGYLYIENDELCLVALNSCKSQDPRWVELDSKKLFVSKARRQKDGRRVQDVRAEGIPEGNWQKAAKLAQVTVLMP